MSKEGQGPTGNSSPDYSQLVCTIMVSSSHHDVNRPPKVPASTEQPSNGNCQCISSTNANSIPNLVEWLISGDLKQYIDVTKKLRVYAPTFIGISKPHAPCSSSLRSILFCLIIKTPAIKMHSAQLNISDKLRTPILSSLLDCTK